MGGVEDDVLFFGAERDAKGKERCPRRRHDPALVPRLCSVTLPISPHPHPLRTSHPFGPPLLPVRFSPSSVSKRFHPTGCAHVGATHVHSRQDARLLADRLGHRCIPARHATTSFSNGLNTNIKHILPTGQLYSRKFPLTTQRLPAMVPIIKPPLAHHSAHLVAQRLKPYHEVQDIFHHFPRSFRSRKTSSRDEVGARLKMRTLGDCAHQKVEA